MSDGRGDEFDEQAPEGGEGLEDEVMERPADLPPGFEHMRFRASPEVAEALRKMTLLRDD